MEERFEARFCRTIQKESGLIQIGIVDPWKTDIKNFIREEIQRATDGMERNSTK